MNFGTIIRTILAIATCLNTALMATDVAQFGNQTLDLVYRIASVILNFVIVFCVTYYNNDYSEEGCIGTGLTRQLKAQKTAGYIGEYMDEDDEEEFFDEVEEDEQEDIPAV